jgi:hypothetical protein
MIYGLSLLCGAGCFICAIMSLPERTHHDVFPLWSLPLWILGFMVCWAIGCLSEDEY